MHDSLLEMFVIQISWSWLEECLFWGIRQHHCLLSWSFR